MPPAHTVPWHQRLMQRLPQWLQRPVLRFEAEIRRSLCAFAAELPAGSRVLDAGAGECQHAQRFAHCRYTGVDLRVGDASWNYSRIDVVGDLARLPFVDRAFAAALNIVVLEHTTDPAQVLAELARVMQPGGRLLLIAPQEWGMHQTPHDYFRYTRFGLELLLGRAGFGDLQIAPVGGFFTLLGRRCLEATLFFQGGWRWLLLPFVALLAGPVGVLLPCLDALDRRKLTTLGYVVRARRAR